MIDYMMTYFLIFVLSALCLLPFAVFLRKGKPDIFEPIYLATAYFFLIFVLRALYIINGGSEFISSSDIDYQTLIALNTALMYLIPSYLMFLAGYYVSLNKSIAAGLPELPREWDLRRFYVFVPVIMAVSIWSYILLIRYFGGFNYYASHKQESLTSGGQQYYLAGISLTMQLLTISFTIYFGKRNNRFINGFFAFFILLPAVLLYSLLSGSKGVFMLPVLSLLIVYHYLKKPIKPVVLVLFLSLYILIAPFFDNYRSVTHVSDMPAVVQKSLDSYDLGDLLKHGMARFHDLEALTFIIRDTPEVMDYQYGKTFLPVFVAWIPRQLWPEKPIVVFGKIFSETYFSKWFAGTGTAASPTVVGEGYINFNFPGMLMVSFFSGIFLRSSYEYFIKRNFGAPGIFFMSFNFMFVAMFWEGSIAGFMAMMMTNVICFILFVIMMGKIKTGRSDEEYPAEAGA